MNFSLEGMLPFKMDGGAKRKHKRKRKTTVKKTTKPKRKTTVKKTKRKTTKK